MKAQDGEIYVDLQYEGAVAQVVEREKERVYLSPDFPFPVFLWGLFQRYPDLELFFPPGELRFAVNGLPPTMDTVLGCGDVVAFASNFVREVCAA